MTIASTEMTMKSVLSLAICLFLASCGNSVDYKDLGPSSSRNTRGKPQQEPAKLPTFPIESVEMIQGLASKDDLSVYLSFERDKNDLGLELLHFSGELKDKKEFSKIFTSDNIFKLAINCESANCLKGKLVFKLNERKLEVLTFERRALSGIKVFSATPDFSLEGDFADSLQWVAKSKAADSSLTTVTGQNSVEHHTLVFHASSLDPEKVTTTLNFKNIKSAYAKHRFFDYRSTFFAGVWFMKGDVYFNDGVIDFVHKHKDGKSRILVLY
jgi:hypothetical protein